MVKHTHVRFLMETTFVSGDGSVWTAHEGDEVPILGSTVSVPSILPGDVYNWSNDTKIKRIELVSRGEPSPIEVPVTQGDNEEHIDA